MSLMVNGELRDEWLEAEREQGAFVRKDSVFRNWITPDGRPGSTGEGDFKAEPGRYHLYVSHACPWSHRTVILRKLKRLEDVISMSVVHPHMGAKGWTFEPYPGATKDAVNGRHYLYEIYKLARPDYTGIVQVPVLWDKEQKTIVNNESSEIIRMFNSAFEDYTEARTDYYRNTCGMRSMKSINSSMLTLTTVCIAAVSPPRSKPMKPRSIACSRP